MPLPQASPLKRLFTLDEVEVATTFARPTIYRWHSLGLIELVHVASRTFMTAEELGRLVSGEVELPNGHRARHLHAPRNEAITPRRRRGRPRKPAPTETG
jgi:hypothetical protein